MGARLSRLKFWQVNGKVSLGLQLSPTVISKRSSRVNRLKDFLHNTELLDSFPSQEGTDTISPDKKDNALGFRDATFAWSNGGALPSSTARSLLKIEGELLFKQGTVNLIVGPTGSVKQFVYPFVISLRPQGITSLLMALLGDDETEIGEKVHSPLKDGLLVLKQRQWLTLSGGQRARVTLARAIYADTDTTARDDVLAALDVHTANWIVACVQVLCNHLLTLTSDTTGNASRVIWSTAEQYCSLPTTSGWRDPSLNL